MDALKTYLAAKRGRLVKLARELEINPSAMAQWDRIPAERVISVENATGIPRQDLRPDLYPAQVA